MAIFEVGTDKFHKIAETTFSNVGLKERSDLQRLLRGQIEIISPDTLVIAEEFGEWEDAKRRIDLLGVDRDANLVVLELKRTEDGGHMELQAVRYAAMVSTMTFDKVVEVYARYLKQIESDADARARLLEFLGWDEPDEEQFAHDVRIVLASAEFSKELTVIWLNDRGLDIRCIRIKPYKDNGRVLVDVQQVIPLPEAAEYQVQIKEKQQRERKARQSKDFTRYDVVTAGARHECLPKRRAIYTVVKFLCDKGVAPEAVSKAIGTGRSVFRERDGEINFQEFVAGQGAGDALFDQRRYFCEDEELIRFGGKTYAFTNQWGTETAEFINNLISAFPDKQVTCTPSP